MSEYSEMSRDDLIALVVQYEALTDELITRMMDTETFSSEGEGLPEMTSFEAKMIKILQFYIRYSASNSRSRAWGGLFSDFGFKSTVNEKYSIFSGNPEPYSLSEYSMGPQMSKPFP